MTETQPSIDDREVLDRMVENFDAYDHDIAQRVYDVTDHARSRCPVTHSNSHGGYWLVTGYAEVREALSTPEVYSSSEGVGFPHHQALMMPPIDLDPPLQKDFRRLLNRHFSTHGIAKYAEEIRTIAETVVAGFVDRGEVDLQRDFAAPFTAEVLARVIMHVEDDDLFRRAREVASQVSRNDPNEEGDKRAALEQIAEEILDQRAASAQRADDCIDSLIYGEVDGRPITRDERVGTLMILVMGGLSTTNAALTSIVRHIAAQPELEQRLRNDPDWVRHDLDEFLRYEAPVGSLSRTVMCDAVLGPQQLARGDTVLLHYASANRDPAVFDHPATLDLEREKNPHLSFGLGNHRCIGSNLARLQIDIGMSVLLHHIGDIRLADGAELVRETGSGSGWVSLPITFSRRAQ